jgi:hypothetical protein
MKTTGKRFLALILITGAVGISVATYLYFKHIELCDYETGLHFDARTLVDEYNDSEAKANDKYLGKVVQVRGLIKGYSGNPNGSFSIYLNDSFFGVTCTFDSAYAAYHQELFNQLKLEQQIDIKGRCDGILTDVRLSKCSFVDP